MKSFQIFLMSILEVKGLAKEEKVHTYAVTNLAEHAWQLITHLIPIVLKERNYS